MAKAVEAVKEAPDLEDLENIEFDVDIVREDILFGQKVLERRDSISIKKNFDIPMGYEREVTVDGKKVTIGLYINVPASIDPDIYYPE